MKRKLNIKNNSSVASEKTQLRGVNAMKTNKIKKAVLAVTLAASMAIPTLTLSTAMTAQAASNVAFCDDTDNNGAINIQEDQIYVSRSYYEAKANTFQTEITDEVNELYIDDNTRFIISKDNISVQPLARYVLSFTVSGDNLSESDLRGMRLNIKFQNKDKSVNNQIAPSILESRGKNKYYVSYDFTAYGESLSFYSCYIKNKNLKCSNALLTSVLDNDDYYLIEAKPADGEKLFIRIKIDESISWDNMEAWAKRICMYANSLSMTTGVKLDTLYMDFDYPDCPYHAFSSNRTMNADNNKYGYVAFNQYASKDVRSQIATGRNSITWVELHEIGHSYAKGLESRFADYYDFCDEYFTNARGITAIQNCDNLRDTDIVFETVGFSRKYDTMLYDVYSLDPKCDMFGFASGLGSLPWDQLETFFAAEYDNDPGFVVSKGLAKRINEYVGINVPLSERYLKFANTIRKLMVLNNNGKYDETKLVRFIVTNFSKELFKEIITNLELDKAEDNFNL